MKIKQIQYFCTGIFTLLLGACGGGSTSNTIDPDDAFIIMVRTSMVDLFSSSDTQFEIPTTGGGYNYNVDCDSDGTNEATAVNGNYICNYNTAGDYTISITGDFPQIYSDFSND